jgi:lipopolysaccharide/colanic/teichoic acid biosynthesis glycosyltransferase
MVDVALQEKISARSVSGRALRYGKSWRGRLFDVVLSGLLLLLLAPVMVGLALIVYLQDGGPVLFAQPRLGFGGKTFRCYKFRSMCVDAEARLDKLLKSSPQAYEEWGRDHKLKVDPRITVIGGILRKYSLDELPQLLNVLKGDMTLVGPRPIVEAEIWRYGWRFKHYCAVTPGLTGLWQVSGRSNTSYRLRVAMDVIYARRRNALLDLKVLAATIPAVILTRGSY